MTLNRKLRKPLLRLALVFASLVLCLFMVEMGLRLTGRGRSINEILDANPPMFLSSPVLHYALKPHFKGRHRTLEFDVGIELNTHGYRSPEFLRSKRGQFRVLCVGDSFTFGHGVEREQGWPALVESALSESFKPRNLEVINAGYQGCWYPDGYLLYLTRSGFLLEPDLVVVGFFMGNDLDHWPLPPRLQDHWRELDSEGLPKRIQGSNRIWRGYYGSRPPRLSRYPVLRDSRLAQMLVERLKEKLGRGRRRSPVKVPEADIYQLPWSSRVQEKYELLEVIFAAMKERAELNNSRLAVVLFPELRQMKTDGADSQEQLHYPQQQMVEMFQRLDVPCLDLLSSFQQKGGSDLYYPVDQHWNPAGNELAAQHIAEFVDSLRDKARE